MVKKRKIHEKEEEGRERLLSADLLFRELCTLTRVPRPKVDYWWLPRAGGSGECRVTANECRVLGVMEMS